MKKVLIFLTMFMSLYAQTFNVSTSEELRKALSKAATSGENDTIILADGIYKTTDYGKGAFAYFSNEDNNLTIKGSNPNKVILSGDNKNQILNFQSDENVTLKLENLTFKDGNTSNNGGGVYCKNNLIVNDCTFINNSAYIGGGFYAGSAIVTNSTFVNNGATIYIDDNSYSSGGGGGFCAGSAIVNNSTFTNNSCSSGAGGGFYTSSDVIVNNSTFTKNNAGAGGGFLSNSEADISNSTFTNNSAGGAGGGFVSLEASVDTSLFDNNSANGAGGFYSLSVAAVANSIFTNNSATKGYGGGFYSAELTAVINSIFTNNSAGEGVGGGFYSANPSYSNKAISIVINSLFANNENAIYLETNKNYIYNSVFINNSNYDINGESDAKILALNNNYIDLYNTVNVTNIPSNNIFKGVNLGFVDAKDGNYHLTAASGLINKGTTDINISEIPSFKLLPVDLDGNPRIVGNSIDIGPYEFNGSKINNKVLINVKSGWNLISIPSEITDLSTIDADIIWKWDNVNKNWEAYSKDTNLLNNIKSQNIPVISKLNTSDGVWVYEKTTKTLTFKNSGTQNLNLSKLSKGWNLIGTITPIDNLSIFNNAKIIWVYDSNNKSWSAYSSNSETMNAINNAGINAITSIPANSGIWVFMP